MRPIVNFSSFKENDEWVLRIQDDQGNYAGVGVLNGQQEAEAIVKALNAVLSYTNTHKITHVQGGYCHAASKPLRDLLA